jgi:ABC-type Mn2+/Zn2+ transport system permease subunit
MAIGFVVGGAGTFYLQRRFAGDAFWKAALKALVAGIFVGTPWPLAGTLLGGWVLLASGITNAKGRLLRG